MILERGVPMLKKLALRHYAMGIPVSIVLWLLFTYLGENLFYAGALQNNVMRRISLILAALAIIGFAVCLIATGILFIRRIVQAQK
jgi:hypothetical protein